MAVKTVVLRKNNMFAKLDGRILLMFGVGGVVSVLVGSVRSVYGCCTFCVFLVFVE